MGDYLMNYQSTSEMVDNILKDSKRIDDIQHKNINNTNSQYDRALEIIGQAYDSFDQTHNQVLSKTIENDTATIIKILDDYIADALKVTPPKVNNHLSIEISLAQVVRIKFSKFILLRQQFLNQFDDLPVPVILYAYNKMIQQIRSYGYHVVSVDIDTLIHIISNKPVYSEENESKISPDEVPTLRFEINYFDNPQVNEPFTND